MILKNKISEMDLEKSIQREKEIIAEINKGNTENLQELLKLARDFNEYYRAKMTKTL